MKKNIIRKIARNNGISECCIRTEMQLGLEKAWKTNDPDELRRRSELFPEGKPTLDKFISRIEKAIY